MISINKGLAAGAVLGALSLGACATHQDVADAVAPVDARSMANADHINQVGTRVVGLEGRVNEVDATAQEALNRATAAGQLAEGKFLYTVVLADDSVKFPLESAELSPEATARLDELARQLMAENRNVYLEIQGFTDATGDEEFNRRLGEERAESVRRYLASKGVPLNRINTISYGQEYPVADNSTREGRAQNRRVVIQVLS